MSAIKTILLSTEGSECSARAMAYALSFAEQYGGRVVALHVIDQRWEEQTRIVFDEVGQDLTGKIRNGCGEKARRILREVTDAASKVGVPVESRVLTGIPSEDISRVAQELPADIIIMGTHGRAGMLHLYAGECG